MSFRVLKRFAVVVALVAILFDPAEAGSRCRSRSRCSVRSLCLTQQPCQPAGRIVSSDNPQPTPIDAPASSLTAGVESRSRTRTVTTSRVVCDGVSCRQRSVTVTRSVAQSRAEALALLDPGSGLQQGHHAALGPVSGYEGLGYGSSPEEATRRCCFYGQRPIREVGTAQGPRGWYAVILYD